MTGFFVVLGLLVAIIILIIVIVLLGPPWLAKEDVLFTTVKEGTVKAIMRGTSFDRFIMSFEGYHLNNPKAPYYKPNYTNEKSSVVKLPEWEILYHGEGNKYAFEKTNDEYYDERHWFLKYLGLYWVGWPWANNVYVYQFEWNETFTEEGTGVEKILPRAEATDFIYASDFTYAVKTDGAETKDLLPIDVLTLVTVAIRNPYRALFSGQGWIQRLDAAINRHVRVFIGSKGYNNLISLTDNDEEQIGAVLQKSAEEFSRPIIDLSKQLAYETDKSPEPKGLRGKYGVEIRTADLQTIELSGDIKKELQTAATKVYTSEQDAKSTRLTGRAKADVIAMVGEKEAEALETRLEVIKKHGHTGELLAQLDAMREAGGAGARIIWANNPFIPKEGGKS